MCLTCKFSYWSGVSRRYSVWYILSCSWLFLSNRWNKRSWKNIFRNNIKSIERSSLKSPVSHRHGLLHGCNSSYHFSDKRSTISRCLYFLAFIWFDCPKIRVSVPFTDRTKTIAQVFLWHLEFKILTYPIIFFVLYHSGRM